MTSDPFDWYPGTSLREWRLHNFKSATDAVVALSPLTVVIGENSAGKSTLLQSIRAVSQAARASGSAFPLNGDLVRLGTYEETVSAAAPADDSQIGIGGTFHFESLFHAAPNSSPSTPETRRLRRVAGELHDGNLEWDVRLDGAPERQPGQTVLRGASARACWADGEVMSVASEDAGSSGTRGNRAYPGWLRADGGDPVRLATVSHEGGFPTACWIEADLVGSIVETWNASAARVLAEKFMEPKGHTPAETPVGQSAEPLASVVAGDIRWVVEHLGLEVACLPDSERRISSLMTGRLRERGPMSGVFNDGGADVNQVKEQLGIEATATRRLDPPDPLQVAVELARHFVAENVFHLGPLRTDPQVVYTSAPVGRTGSLGAKGEFCAAVLQSEGQSPVDVPMPRGQVGDMVRGVPLNVAVDAWAKELGVGVAFTTADKGRLGIEIGVRQPNIDMDLDLTSVGTGVSQILPVLVLCLLAPVGSLLLLEQPELHLNPAVQQRLADFLLAVAGSGRQLVVETHSDYLVGRLRRRVAENPMGNQVLVSLLFTELRNGQSVYESVSVAADGSLPRWPAGFFDLAAEDAEATLRAALVGNPRDS